MKYALILLIIASFLIAMRFSKSTAYFRVENISEIDKASKVQISIDREVIFNGIVNEIPSKFRTKLSRGNHYLVVRADNGELVQTQQFKVKGKTRIVVTYKAEYQLDPATQKPLPDGALSRHMWLSIGDWDYPTNTVYVEVPRS